MTLSRMFGSRVPGGVVSGEVGEVGDLDLPLSLSILYTGGCGVSGPGGTDVAGDGGTGGTGGADGAGGADGSGDSGGSGGGGVG